MSYLDDARAGKQLTSATLMVALSELGNGAVLTLTTTGAVVTVNGTHCSAPTAEAALTGKFVAVPAIPPAAPATPSPPNPALAADLATAEAAIEKAASDNH